VVGISKLWNGKMESKKFVFSEKKLSITSAKKMVL